jgi:alginate O-acetyltransferase complex protein AlgF
VIMTTFNTWTVTCGGCAANPGTYTISQPDPEKLVFVGPGGVSSGSRYEAARAICKCPSESSRRAREEQMRTFDGK